ncbi:hypothetical protein QF035_008879 [Streptomyces umbrinus]|uniref:Uncharacterized protein n=1 Tax=Streptomyces umbrinus TaxID=67370 RepID=A0ABU0T6T5_9ACTN|nr:hypothetical protein [Streptomyces umbrinus]
MTTRSPCLLPSAPMTLPSQTDILSSLQPSDSMASIWSFIPVIAPLTRLLVCASMNLNTRMCLPASIACLAWSRALCSLAVFRSPITDHLLAYGSRLALCFHHTCRWGWTPYRSGCLSGRPRSRYTAPGSPGVHRRRCTPLRVQRAVHGLARSSPLLLPVEHDVDDVDDQFDQCADDHSSTPSFTLQSHADRSGMKSTVPPPSSACQPVLQHSSRLRTPCRRCPGTLWSSTRRRNRLSVSLLHLRSGRHSTTAPRIPAGLPGRRPSVRNQI